MNAKTHLCALALTLLATSAAFAQVWSDDDLELTGGYLKRPGVGCGSVVLVNAQNRASRAMFDVCLAYFTEKLSVDIRVENGTFCLTNPVVRGNASLFIVDDPALPMSLVAPESRWAMVNVARIYTDKPAFFKARFSKLLSRGFCYLCGVGESAYLMPVTGCVTDAKGLDVFRDHRVPADVLDRCRKYLPGYGVKPFVISTYREACKEGWAPAPTNDFQKEIWDEIKDPKKRFDRELPDLKKK